MTNAVSVLRALLIYAICIPLAIFLGYLGANWEDRMSLFWVGGILGLLLLPLILKHHHPVLILVWNTTMIFVFLPGSPNLWMLMAAISFSVSLLQNILSRKTVLPVVSSVSRPLIFFGLVVMATALLTGGIGFKALGQETGGGKRYIAIFLGILGFYAMSAHQIPPNRAKTYFAMYFLSGLTLAIGSLGGYLPGFLNFLFYLFPVDSANWYMDIGKGFRLGTERYTGISFAFYFLVIYLLGRYGIRGTFMSGRPWRIFFLAFAVLGTMLGGYRSVMLLVTLVFMIQFFLEGLHRTHLLAIICVLGVAMASITLPFAKDMPYSFQRALSVFHVPVSNEVEIDTKNSNEWRVRMWKQVLPQIPKYLILGKGFGINIRENLMTQELVFTRREVDNTASAQMAQDYHNGPLSVLIPLGIFGLAGLIWFWIATYRLLLANFRYGDAELRNMNTLLLALFLTKVLHFIFVFGSLHLDFYQFAGLAGLSAALNGGMARKPVEATPQKSTRPRAPTSILPQTRPAYGR